jgi:hypothetical protein
MLKIKNKLLCIALIAFSSFAYADIRVPAGESIQPYFNVAAGQKLIISGGSYSTNGLTCVNDVEIVSDGKVTITTTSNAPIFNLSGCNNVSLRGNFELVGNGSSYTTHPSSQIVDGGQSGIYLNNSTDISIDGNIEIRNMRGSGIRAENTTLTSPSVWHPNITISGIYAHDNYHGIRTYNKAEYIIISNSLMSRNLFGFFIDSGNITVSNSIATDNSNGVALRNGVNGGHGSFTGLLANHNYYNLSVSGVSVGHSFVGCFFLSDQSGLSAGAIQIINSKGINLIGGQIGSNITVDATSQLSLQSNYIRTTLSNINVSTGAVLISKGNFTETGLWAGNN